MRDAAILLGALAGVDPRDKATTDSKGKSADDYTKLLDKYPKVPFPWESLEALHQRVLELDPLSQPREQGEDVAVPGAKSALAG